MADEFCVSQTINEFDVSRPLPKNEYFVPHQDPFIKTPERQVFDRGKGKDEC